VTLNVNDNDVIIDVTLNVNDVLVTLNVNDTIHFLFKWHIKLLI